MTIEELHSIARQILIKVAQDHPDVAADIATLLLSEILAIGLHADDDQAATAAFVDALNGRLAEIALHYRASRAWQLEPCDPPQRH